MGLFRKLFIDKVGETEVKTDPVKVAEAAPPVSAKRTSKKAPDQSKSDPDPITSIPDDDPSK